MQHFNRIKNTVGIDIGGSLTKIAYGVQNETACLKKFDVGDSPMEGVRLAEIQTNSLLSSLKPVLKGEILNRIQGQ